VFSQFGDIRCMDVPILDPYREEITTPSVTPISSGITTFKFGQDLVFDVYIQYREYMCFVKCMEALRGMKLMHINKDGKAHTANVRVDFDKTKHLTDKVIKRRELEAKKIRALLLEKERKKQAEREYEENRMRELARKEREEREEKERRKRERERKRKEKIDEIRKAEEEKQMAIDIAKEERKILIAQRKLESIRLLTELFNKIKKEKTEEELERRERELVEEQKRLAEEKVRREAEAKRRRIEDKAREKADNERKEKELREKILAVMKEKEERRLAEEREALRRRLSGQVRLRSAVVLSKAFKSKPPHR